MEFGHVFPWYHKKSKILLLMKRAIFPHHFGCFCISSLIALFQLPTDMLETFGGEILSEFELGTEMFRHDSNDSNSL